MQGGDVELDFTGAPELTRAARRANGRSDSSPGTAGSASADDSVEILDLRRLQPELKTYRFMRSGASSARRAAGAVSAEAVESLVM